MAKITDSNVQQVFVTNSTTAPVNLEARNNMLTVQVGATDFRSNLIYGNNGLGTGVFTGGSARWQVPAKGRLHGIICTLADISGFEIATPSTFGSSSTINASLTIQGSSFPPTGIYDWHLPDSGNDTGQSYMQGNIDFFRNFPTIISQLVRGNETFIKLKADFDADYGIAGGIPVDVGDSVNLDFSSSAPSDFNSFLTCHTYQVLYSKEV